MTTTKRMTVEEALADYPEDEVITAENSNEDIEDEVADDESDEDIIEDDDDIIEIDTKAKAKPKVKFKFTQVDGLPQLNSASLDSQLTDLQAKLDEARETEDKAAQIKILDDMNKLVGSIKTRGHIDNVTSAFKRVFADEYSSLEVFKSKEWSEFGDKKRYGQSRMSIWQQAIASNDIEGIEEFLTEFQESLNISTKPTKKQPVTPRSTVSSAAAPIKMTTKLALRQIEARYDAAIAKVISGGISRTTFNEIEKNYKAALAKAA